jgi:hypothetical protein
VDLFFRRTLGDGYIRASDGTLSFPLPGVVTAKFPGGVYKSTATDTLIQMSSIFDERRSQKVDVQELRLLLFLMMLDGNFPAHFAFVKTKNKSYITRENSANEPLPSNPGRVFFTKWRGQGNPINEKFAWGVVMTCSHNSAPPGAEKRYA